MQPAKKIEQEKILRDLVPINALSDERFNELVGKIEVEEVKAGRYLFRKGERDNQTIYLLSGKVHLIDGFRKIVGEITAGEDVCRFPIVAQQPRPHSVRVVKKAVIARVDTGLLDVFLTWDQSNPSDAVEISAEDNSDWMTRILQSPTFVRLPPSKLQGLLMKLRPLTVHSGDVIVAEGGEGDYFYIIHEGRCAVTRRNATGDDQRLAELGNGDSFGEEALVSSNRRNATVTMLTDGQLMRLAKQDFVELLHTELVRTVAIAEARQMVADGAVWVDVRTADEYAQGSFEDSVNIPLAELRGEIPELVFNACYILCCDTGRRSDCAAFLLSHKGFDVYVLAGGMAELSDFGADDEVQAACAGPAQMADESAPGAVDAACAEPDALPDTSEELREELAASRENEARLRKQLEQLRGELGESTGKLGELYDSIRKHDEEKSLLYEQYGALQEEHTEVLTELQARLEQEQGRAAGLQDSHERLQQEHRRLCEQLTEPGDGGDGQQEILQQDLSAARERIAELEDTLRNAGAGRDHDRREVENAVLEHARQMEAQGDELATARDEIGRLTGLLDDAQRIQQAQEQSQAELQERNAELEGMAERLQTQLDDRTAQLERQAESGAGDGNVLEAELAQLREQLEAQAGREDGQAALAAQLEEQQRIVAELQAELDSVGADSAQRVQQLAGQNDAELSQQESRVAELQQAVARQDEALESLQRERAELHGNLQQAEQERVALEQEIAAQQEQASALIASHEEELALLQSRLIEGEEQREQLRGVIAEKDARIEQSTLQSGQFEVEKGVLEQELELLRKQHVELQEQADANEQRARAVAEELRETARKSHEELRRKNDNEKELQGQIDRLHKKLEQVTADYRNARSDAQDGLDNLREELHAERAARAEERAQMAARQRELKDQLAAIANEHEDKITNHSGVIEEAVAAVRSEEHTRLQSVLEAQAATAEQHALLEQELKLAHAELAEFQRQEKDRRQSDIELMQEQNQQAEAAIGQLQAQLKELVRERDSALEEQQGLREKMDAVRGELEAARVEASRKAQETAEDPVELRKQLDETRRNVEVTVRLRGEAEAARERMEEERDRLLVQVENMRAGAVHAPPGARAASAGPSHAGRQPVAAGVSVPAAPVRKRSRWPLPVFGVLAALLAVGAAGWLMLRGGLPLLGSLPIIAIDTGMTAEQDVAGDVRVVTSGSESADMPGAKPPVQQSLPPKAQSALVAQPEAGEAEGPVVLGNFRDRLRGGGSGPLMVELAAASFQMGSPGKADNFEEVPRHEVSLGSFSISSTEVTFAEYDRFARATGRRRPSDEKWGRGDQPVINVTWNDAQAYVQWLSEQTGRRYRLPAEAEWEYAARAGTTDSYWWDDDVSEIPANCFNCGSRWDGARTAPVGRFAANGFGLHDMAGNVQEWTADCYHENYQGAPADGAAWTTPGCTLRVVRGGSYSSPLDALRSARRAQLEQDTRLDNLGFRVVRDN